MDPDDIIDVETLLIHDEVIACDALQH